MLIGKRIALVLIVVVALGFVLSRTGLFKKTPVPSTAVGFPIILNGLTVQPNSDGQLIVKDVRSSLLKELNLVAGDELYAYDKYKIESYQAATKIFNDLNKKSANLVIKRAGKKYVIKIPEPTTKKVAKKVHSLPPPLKHLAKFKMKAMFIPRKELGISGKKNAEYFKGSKMLPVLGKDKKIRGYSFESIAKNSFLEKLKIEKGDQVLYLNGKSVDSEKKMMGLVDRMRLKNKTQGPVDVFLKRGDRHIRYKYILN